MCLFDLKLNVLNFNKLHFDYLLEMGLGPEAGSKVRTGEFLAQERLFGLRHRGRFRRGTTILFLPLGPLL